MTEQQTPVNILDKIEQQALQDFFRQYGGPKLQVEVSVPFHADGLHFIDILDGDKHILIMQSPKHGWGVDYNHDALYGDWAPQKRIERDQVVPEVLRMLSATHQHYKGGFYRVHFERIPDTETGDIKTVYEHVWPHEPQVKCRNADLFFDEVAPGIPRFKPLRSST